MAATAASDVIKPSAGGGAPSWVLRSGSPSLPHPSETVNCVLDTYQQELDGHVVFSFEYDQIQATRTLPQPMLPTQLTDHHAEGRIHHAKDFYAIKTKKASGT